MHTVDLAILDATLWSSGARLPEADALAVCGDRIAAIGRSADLRRLITGRTRVVEAGGRLLLPGFNDAHVHFVSAGFGLGQAELRTAGTRQEFAAAVARYAARQPPGTWLANGQWDHEAWPDRRRPDRQLLDAVAPQHPVFLCRLDGHIGVANSLALERAGVRRDTPDPAGGTIERDPGTGEPTGILVDTAMDLVARHLPEPTAAERRQAALAACRHAAALGVTSVHALGDVDDFLALQELRSRGELCNRVYMVLPARRHQALAELGLRPGFGDPLLRLGAVKLFADGSLGARSALFFEPYEDDPSTCGLAMQSEADLCRQVAELDRAGLQVALHAIGDQAVHWALNAFEGAAQANGTRPARHRVEHAQAVQPQDRARFADLGVLASLQPYHCTDDMRWVERRLGGRARYAYPYRSLVDHGARVAVGTDWPVEPLDPMLALYAAATREFPAGGPTGGWYPEEKVSLAQAVTDYTYGSAFAEFEETRKGTLAVGQLADLVLLSRDLFAIPPREILETKAVLTVLGGQVVSEVPGQGDVSRMP